MAESVVRNSDGKFGPMIAETRRALTLASVSALARVPGFLIPVLVAAAFGAGSHTDAYFIAYSAVLFIGGTLAQSVEVAIVPFAAREFANGRAAASTFLRRTTSRVVAIVAAVWVVALPLVVLGAAASLRPQVVTYGLWFSVLLLVWGAASVYSGALVAQADIAGATGSLLWRGGGGLLGLALSPVGGGLVGVAIGLGVGELARLWWLRRRSLGKPDWERSRGTPALGSFGRAATAMMLAGIAGSFAPVLEKLLAVRLGPGSASRLEYATRVLIIPAVLFDGALAPLLLARWSRVMAAEGRAPSRREILRAVGMGMLVALGVASVMAAFAPQAVTVLLLHGKFTSSDAAAVASLLRVMAIGFVGSMGALLVERAYLATARNHVIAMVSVLRVVVRVGMALVLLPTLHLLAFAVGFSVAEWSYFATLSLFVARQGPTRVLAAVRVVEET